MSVANVPVATTVMVKAQELGLGLDIVKHATQKAFQVDSALHVETHFWRE
jgi:hypothetical protein